MSVSIPIYGPVAAYRRTARLSRNQRLLAWAGVAAIHALALGSLLFGRVKDEAPPPAPALMVSLVADTAPAPQPAPPTPPAPKPEVMSSPRPTPSPMVAPPRQEPAPPAPVQPSATPQPPSTATPSAPSPAPAAVTPPNFTAAYLNNPGPQYPYESRRKREQGTVRMKVHVSADGRPEQVQLDRSSGFPNLDAAALDVVKKRWRFVPAKQGDRPVAAWVAVPMQFELKDR